MVYFVKRQVDHQLDRAWNGINSREQAGNRLLRTIILCVLAVALLVVGLLAWVG
ncbi:hypothetical protein MUN81_14865 [Hymenobacter sp. 5317J-9]|uniref:hypothetical protein n=1 Tax=Hymenobacter sp. 5317J-9 TaxID=2932250 RepID=UPI001FD6D519|nr:hypothetical protein [Hymenobacter sp. 5317J-9]UOQ96518.1 hypothetical protein MUN81_14865 [Hymenobacter sp. 5317J-9]